MSAEVKSDIDVIVPQLAVVDVGGVKARVRRLRAIELITLIGAVTEGMGGAIQKIRLDTKDEDVLKGQILGLLIVAVPSAPESFIRFLAMMVEPVDEQDHNRLKAEMSNPHPVAMLDILDALAEQEKQELVVLAGKAQAMVRKMATPGG